MRRLVTFLAELKGERVSTIQGREITMAIDQMTTLIDLPNRGLSTLNTLLPNPATGRDAPASVHERLIPWARGGEYGWVFDNDADLLNLEPVSGHNTIFGFDLTEFLDDDNVRSV